ncbi:MAG: hypothetical protein NVSMB68_09160 [Thermoanaerobaculia bacterium]
MHRNCTPGSLVRFVVEQRHLTDMNGKPVSQRNTVSFHTFDAESVDDAILLHVKKQSGELIGNVLKFPGLQAVATLRNVEGVHTLQITPASQGPR